MSETTSEERMETFRSVIWMQTGVEPTQSVTDFQQPKLSWEYQGNKAELVFSERPFLTILEDGAIKNAPVGSYTAHLANHTDEEILNALKWFKVI